MSKIDLVGEIVLMVASLLTMLSIPALIVILFISLFSDKIILSLVVLLSLMIFVFLNKEVNGVVKYIRENY